MKRWLTLILALGFAALAGYALLTALPGGPKGPSASAPRAGSSAPADHIDRASREAMRDILREAERDESR